MDCFVIKSYLQTGLLLHTEDPCAASAEPSQPVQYGRHRRHKKTGTRPVFSINQYFNALSAVSAKQSAPLLPARRHNCQPDRWLLLRVQPGVMPAKR